MRSTTFRKITERRANTRRWVYVVCAVIAVWLGVLSAGMQDDLRGVLPYLAIAAISVVQYVRPTLLGWFVLAVPFASYTALVAVHFERPVQEFVMFLLIGLLPTLALSWSWPKALEASDDSA